MKPSGNCGWLGMKIYIEDYLEKQLVDENLHYNYKKSVNLESHPKSPHNSSLLSHFILFLDPTINRPENQMVSPQN
jgi:hypothetical protein